ncbi:MAG: hypothetical protein C5B55_00875 [Blastocatellia bacterium]|nr:MAG: hypothetical protein C5B55_00875 [Blastocatellia bacterium]
MSKINWMRVLVSGLVTCVVWSFLSAVSTYAIGQDFAAAAPSVNLMKPSAGLFFFLLSLNIIAGIWAMWLYAAIRPRYGPGPRTAVVTGVAWWIVVSLADATWGSFQFVPIKALVPLMAVSLPETVVATLVGAWLYKE